MRWPSIGRADQGFTIVEVLIALVVTSGAALVIGLLVNASLESVRDAREHVAIALLARERIELIRSHPAGGSAVSPAASLDTDTTGYTDTLDIHGTQVGTPSQTVFTRRWRIQPTVAGSSTGHVIRIRVLGVRAKARSHSTAAPNEVSLPVLLHR